MLGIKGECPAGHPKSIEPCKGSPLKISTEAPISLDFKRLFVSFIVVFDIQVGKSIIRYKATHICFENFNYYTLFEIFEKEEYE